MWKSSKKRREETFERALGEMPDAAASVSEKWKFYVDRLPFRSGVPLAEQIRLFSFPLAEYFRTNYPNISSTQPSVHLSTLLIGVYLAKTHPIPELLEVARHMEDDLGVDGIYTLITQFIETTPNR